MSAPRSYRGMYVYPWDLADEGVGEAAARLRDLGIDTVTLTASYHAGKFLRPHGKSGKVYFPVDGTVYFHHRPERYGRVKPLPNPMLDGFDPFTALAKEAPDLGRVAWTVLLHNTAQGLLHPDLQSRNCFGDGYVYSLNPAHPDARAYAVALCADLADRHELRALALETPGWLPYDHGYHHEFALVPMNRWAKTLLGLCFAPATIAAAKAAGIDAERLRLQACAWLEAFFASDLAVPDPMALEWGMADLVADPEWQALLAWRCRVVTELVAEIRAAVPRPTEIWVIPSVQRPSAQGWIEGSDLAALAKVADRLEICAYQANAAEVALDVFDVRRRAGPDAVLNFILRPAHPDLVNGAETTQAVQILAKAGAAGFSFYNYGHLRLSALERVRAALISLETT